jgi:muramidase (phage lysozyme)
MAAFKGTDVKNNAAWLIGPVRNAYAETQPIFSEAFKGLEENRAEKIKNNLLAQAFSQYTPQEQQAAASVQDAGAIMPAVYTTKLPSFLDTVAGPESAGNYNVLYGGSEAPLTDMTVDEVLAYQKEHAQKEGSSAAGKYQIVQDTLRGLKNNMGLRGDEKFTPEMQDQMAIKLMEGRGLNEYMQGDISAEQFQNNLAQEWAGLPTTEGKSHYHGDSMGNKAGISSEDISQAITQLKEGGLPTTTPASAIPAPTQAGPRPPSFTESDAFKQALMRTAAQGGDVEALINQATALDTKLANDAKAAETAQTQTKTAWHGADIASTIAGRQTTADESRMRTQLMPAKAQADIAANNARTREANLKIRALEREGNLAEAADRSTAEYTRQKATYVQEAVDTGIEEFKQANDGREPTDAEKINIEAEANAKFQQTVEPQILRELQRTAPESYNRTPMYQEFLDTKAAYVEQQNKIDELRYKAFGDDIENRAKKKPEINSKGEPVYGPEAEDVKAKRKDYALNNLILSDKKIGKIVSADSKELKILRTILKGASTHHRVDPELLIKDMRNYMDEGWIFGIGSGISDEFDLMQAVNERAKALSQQGGNINRSILDSAFNR